MRKLGTLPPPGIERAPLLRSGMEHAWKLIWPGRFIVSESQTPAAGHFKLLNFRVTGEDP